MKALQFSRFGSPRQELALAEGPAPDCPEGSVRLRMLASPINPADLNLIEGTYGVKPELPATGGIEGCGEVVESKADGFAPGDRCIFLAGTGLWAEEVVVGADQLFKLPEGIDPVQAAMLKVNPATAWQMLTGFVAPEEGAWVVQNSANSGVGRAVIQLAPLLGLRTINLVRRESLFGELTDLGADHVLLDDADAVDAAKELCGDARPALALNAVGGDSALRLMNILGPGGVHVTYGAMARKPLKVPNGLLIFKNLQLRGFWLTRWMKDAPADEVVETYQRLAAEVAAGRLSLPVDSTHPLSDFARALARNEEAGREGKVIFTP
jgi:NADPH:quinone reductase-like Zn-dependent oxidoreductase